jgi:hypothetical protein
MIYKNGFGLHIENHRIHNRISDRFLSSKHPNQMDYSSEFKKNEVLAMSLHEKHWRILYRCAVMLLLAAGLPSAIAQNSSHSASGWIVLPASEYAALRNSAYPVEPSQESVPAQATLTKISYDLKIQKELAVGQATLTVDAIKPGWVRIPIPAALLVRDAKLDGKPVSLVSNDKYSGSRSAIFSIQGRAEIILNIVMPVTAATANESLSLPAAEAGITKASIALASQGVEMKLLGGFLFDQSTTASESKWAAYGQGNEALVFSWSKKAEDHRVTLPLRLRGSLTELVGLGEDNTSVQAQVDLEILQGAAQTIKVQLPDKVVINQVGGAMISDWEMKPGELSITFLEPAEKSAKFVLAGEIRTPRDGSIEIPLLRILNSERETGGVAVEVLGAGEITDRKSLGLESADATDLGELVARRQSPSLIAFKFRSGDVKASRSLTVNVARYTQESVLMANIEEARYRILMSDEGKTLVHANYAIRNNRKNFLKITLPKDAAIWSATLSGKPIRPGQTPDGSLLLPLEKGRAGEEAPAFAASIIYFIRGTKWAESGKLKLALPSLDLPVSKTGVQYYHPPLYKITVEPGSYRLQEYQEPASYVLQTHESGAGSGTLARGQAAQQLPLASNDVMDLINVMGGAVKGEDPILGKDSQMLANKYPASLPVGKRAGILPIKLSFPAFGPSIFLVSELTAENQTPVIDFNYEAEKKGGSR